MRHGESIKGYTFTSYAYLPYNAICVGCYVRFEDQIFKPKQQGELALSLCPPCAVKTEADKAAELARTSGKQKKKRSAVILNLKKYLREKPKK